MAAYRTAHRDEPPTAQMHSHVHFHSVLRRPGLGGYADAASNTGGTGARVVVPRCASCRMRATKGPPPPPPPPVDPFAGLPPVPPEQAPPPNSPTLTKTDLVTGLTNPWDMAFLTDGTMFFDERPGPVSVRLPDGTVNLIVAPGDVALGGNGGILGLAVDPSSATNNFLYTCYTTASDERVVRWTVNPTKTGVVGGGTVIVQGIDKAFEQFGCRIRFGPDASSGSRRATTAKAPIHRICPR